MKICQAGKNINPSYKPQVSVPGSASCVQCHHDLDVKKIQAGSAGEHP